MILALGRGQDVNFDQLNYQYYSAYAFLHGRMDLDAAPAQIIHSYFNPLAYVPFYLLFRLAGPVAASAVLAAVQASNLVLVAWIAMSVCRGGTRWQRWASIAAATAISALSPLALSEVGTSFIDVLTSLPVLGAVHVLLRTPRPRAGPVALCGALAGCATGLKLTNATFAIGLLGACLLYGPGLRPRLHAWAAMLAGLAAGFLGASGWWCLALWTRFGNPVFPYYNGLFRSPDFPPTSDIDRRYLPANVLDALAYPFRWAVGIAPQPEIGFTDVRFAAIAVLLAACAVLAAGRRRASDPRRGEDGAGSRLLAVFAVSFAVWLAVFAIQRYIVTLELLCGPVALVLLGKLARGWMRPALGGVLAAAAAVTIRVPDWTHVPFLPGQYGLQVPASLRDAGLFFMAGEPVSYIIPVLSRDARFFGIMEWEDTAATANTAITRRIARAVAESGDRAIRVVANQPLTWQTRLRLGSYGVQPTGECRGIPGYAYRGANVACDLARSRDTGPALITLGPGDAVEFRPDGPGYPLLSGESGTGWQVPGPIGDVRADHYPALIFRRSDGFGGSGLGLSLTYDLIGATNGPSTLAPTVNGAHVVRTALQYDPASGTWRFEGCVGEGAIASDAIVTVELRSESRMIVRPVSLAVSAQPAGRCG